MPQEQKVEQKKEDKKQKEEKKQKPNLLKISQICFDAAKAGMEFEKGVEGLDEHIAKTLADAGQTKNIRGHPITPDNIRSQRAAWMADCKKDRKGEWAKVTNEQDDKGVLKMSYEKEE